MSLAHAHTFNRGVLRRSPGPAPRRGRAFTRYQRPSPLAFLNPCPSPTLGVGSKEKRGPIRVASRRPATTSGYCVLVRIPRSRQNILESSGSTLQGIDWRTVSNDPNDDSASLMSRSLLASREMTYGGARSEWLAGLARGKRVLDVGGGEHVPSASLSDAWEHAIFVEHAESVLGIDISADLVRHLCERGYSFETCDATSQVDLGRRFDLIFAGDVIEHVNDPTALVRFALRHLDERGSLVITTPNPFHIGDPVQSLLRRNLQRGLFRHVNLEHTCWITPTNMLEICHRTDCDLWGLWRPKRPGATPRARLGHHVVNVYAQLLSMRELLYPEFVYEIRPR